MRRILAVTASSAVLLLAAAIPASAHVQISPTTSIPGQFQLYSLQVPNELDDQATVEVDLTLPVGFTLDSAQQVPGWRTITTRTNGAPVAVAWKGGSIPIGTFGVFQLQGRNPAAGHDLTWRTVQRYERSVVRWEGKLGSDGAAPVVRLAVASAGIPSANLPAPSSVGPPTATGPGVDALARSRAALGIALSLAALALGLLPRALAVLRGRLAVRETAPPEQAGVAPPSGHPGSRTSPTRTGRRGG